IKLTRNARVGHAAGGETPPAVLLHITGMAGRSGPWVNIYSKRMISSPVLTLLVILRRKRLFCCAKCRLRDTLDNFDKLDDSMIAARLTQAGSG
ncbi:MAG: hypothetical protein V8Q82_06815, partial [Christensenellales bacterium]